MLTLVKLACKHNTLKDISLFYLPLSSCQLPYKIFHSLKAHDGYEASCRVCKVAIFFLRFFHTIYSLNEMNLWVRVEKYFTFSIYLMVFHVFNFRCYWSSTKIFLHWIFPELRYLAFYARVAMLFSYLTTLSPFVCN